MMHPFVKLFEETGDQQPAWIARCYTYAHQWSDDEGLVNTQQFFTPAFFDTRHHEVRSFLVKFDDRQGFVQTLKEMVQQRSDPMRNYIETMLIEFEPILESPAVIQQYGIKLQWLRQQIRNDPNPQGDSFKISQARATFLIDHGDDVQWVIEDEANAQVS